MHGLLSSILADRFPPVRGWSQEVGRGAGNVSLLPAYAGMARHRDGAPADAGAAPARAGMVRSWARSGRKSTTAPAHAGMVPTASPSSSSRWAAPRARRDGRCVWGFAWCDTSCSLCLWGWPHDDEGPQRSARLFLVRVGVVRVRRGSSSGVGVEAGFWWWGCVGFSVAWVAVAVAWWPW